MPRDSQPPPSPTLELTSLSPTSSISPDSPLLTPTSTAPPPRWALPSRTRLQHLLDGTRTASRAILLRTRRLAPLPRRLSWTSGVLCTLLAYTIACLALSIPPFASRLPAYTGPHAVGAIDMEVPLPQARLIADPVFKHSHTPAFKLETVLLTLYYPASPSASSSSPPLPWIPRPISLTAQGYARFARADNFLTRPLFTFLLWLAAGSVTIPAATDVPLLASSGGAKLPVVVFSHGMASSRTDYTHYLGSLASHGAVVAALEHRDGSCPGTLIHLPDQPPLQRPHFRASDLFTSPTNRTPVDTPSMKRHQLAFRDAEIFETIRLLRFLDANASVPSTRGSPKSLGSFASRLDLDTLVTAGHSYGATAALQALRHAPSSSSSNDKGPNPSVAGIALDPGKESGPLNAALNVSLLVVHSDSWSRQRTLFFGRPHFDTVRDLVAGVLERSGRAAWFLTSLGTSHPSVSDAPLIEPLLLSWTTGATLNVREALGEYVRVSHDFIQSLRTAKVDGILQEKVTHTEYNKWVSDERKASFPKDMARLWEIHVSPASSNDLKGPDGQA
ncbi:platelet-activating factor acetylhydrolase [Metarhizium robertsii]|uniref:Putative phospholipase n=2 Tax=Metarhizium robertsii TaxID=568076 RepID=E9FDB3_METRA|nr:PAF acetylhydrolase [Metarhizium robertsii ARSEF 23]EFY94279.1 PAF acetylhydrolase [Metarhizium robertsii ARSEF 23]EXU97048.1 platelet-activating factor acetylhydrolase [Metarhizium robertsii]